MEPIEQAAIALFVLFEEADPADWNVLLDDADRAKYRDAAARSHLVAEG